MDFFCAAYLFFVRSRMFEVPIVLERSFGLHDEDQNSLFMTWLGEQGSSVLKLARLYPHQRRIG
jgi:hypothetical protein